MGGEYMPYVELIPWAEQHVVWGAGVGMPVRGCTSQGENGTLRSSAPDPVTSKSVLLHGAPREQYVGPHSGGPAA
jgi:hypothetical protein